MMTFTHDHRPFQAHGSPLPVRLRKWLFAVLCVALALCASACGGGGDRELETTVPESEPPVVTEPADRTEPVSDTPIPDTEPATEIDSDEVTTPSETEAPSVEALINRLASDIYTSDQPLAGVAGFSAPAEVGIDPTRWSTVQYPAPADEACARVFPAADYGITPDSDDNSAAMTALIALLRETEGVKKVVFSEGVYRFSQTIVLRGVSDLYLCGETEDTAYTFLMTEWVPGIRVESCADIHFNGFSFDYEHPTAVTGVVVGCDTRNLTVTLRVDEGYDLTYSAYNGGKLTYGSYMEFCYDETAGVYVPDANGNLLYNSTGDGIRNISDGTYDPETRELTLSFRTIKKVAEGTRVNVAFTMYEYFGFYASDCRNVYLEGVAFCHTAGMAMGAYEVENLYLNRVRVAPPADSDRLMSATADCLHCNSCTGEIVVTNSYFAYSHDDAMNIKGAYVKVAASTDRQITYDASTGTLDVQVGHTLDAYEVATFRYLGSYTVTEVNAGSRTYTVAEAVEVDLAGALLCNASTSPSLTVDNCFIGHKRNRGMLVQCRGVEIVNCTFQNVLHGAIQVLSVADVFAEGIMPRNVIIRNNKFINNTVTDVDIFTWGPEGTSSGTILGVDVVHNFFYGTASNAVHLLGAGQCSVRDNLFAQVKGGSVLIETSENITVTDNYSFSSGSIRKSAFRYKEGGIPGLILRGNISEGRNGFLEEPTLEDDAASVPPAEEP